MPPETKKLGELLVEAGLITPIQLQEALRQQRLSGERLGSTLVATGVITEDALMDFLARQTGVPRLDVKNLDIPPAVLQRIPRRLAEQMNILPVAFKEPKSLVLAMADPMDLNAIDSARFASGPDHRAGGGQPHRPAPGHQRTLLQAGGRDGAGCRWTGPRCPRRATACRSPLELMMTPYERRTPGHRRDQPLQLLQRRQGTSRAGPGHPLPVEIIHQRSAMAEQVRPLEGYGTRALVLGLMRMLQRRGILGQDELQRFITVLAESRELDPDQ